MSYPFCLGQACSGDFFVGREQYLKKLKRLVLDPQCPCVSIFGLPRIGKSSIVDQLEYLFKIDNIDIQFVKVNMGDFQSFNEFLMSIINKVLNVLNEANVEVNNFNAPLDRLNNKPDPEGAKRLLERILKFATVKKKRLLISIDEFDFAKTIFCEDASKFQYIRGIINNNEIKVPIILISRDNLQHIETIACGGSRLHLSVKDFPIKEFKTKDMDEYYNRLQTCKVGLGVEEKNKLVYFCGKNPFLLALMGNSLAEQVEDELQISIKSAFLDNREKFYEFYFSVLNHLKNEDLYESFVKTVIGPLFGLKRINLDKLHDKGYITRTVNDDGDVIDLTTISENFVDYVKDNEIQSPSDNLSLILQAERVLRRIIVTGFKEKYSVDPLYYLLKNLYEKNINKKLSGLKKEDTWNLLNQIREHEDADVLKVSSLKDLCKILSTFWDNDICYNKYFSNFKYEDIEIRINLLYKGRNSYCHNCYQYLSEEQVRACEIYAQEIIALNENNRFPEYGIIPVSDYRRAKKEYEKSLKNKNGGCTSQYEAGNNNNEGSLNNPKRFELKNGSIIGIAGEVNGSKCIVLDLKGKSVSYYKDNPPLVRIEKNKGYIEADYYEAVLLAN